MIRMYTTFILFSLSSIKQYLLGFLIYFTPCSGAKQHQSSMKHSLCPRELTMQLGRQVILIVKEKKHINIRSESDVIYDL